MCVTVDTFETCFVEACRITLSAALSTLKMIIKIIIKILHNIYIALYTVLKDTLQNRQNKKNKEQSIFNTQRLKQDNKIKPSLCLVMESLGRRCFSGLESGSSRQMMMVHHR